MKQQSRTSRNQTKLTSEERTLLQLTVLLVASLLLAGSLIYAIVDASEEDEETQSNIVIDDMLTQNATISADNYQFEMLISITNRAKEDIESIRIELAAIDYHAKLTYDRNSQSDFDMEARSTRELAIGLSVPRVRSFKMFIMVFVDDILMIKGYSVVSVEPDGDRADFRVRFTRDYEENEDDDDDGDRVALATLVLVLIMLPLLLVEFSVVLPMLSRERLEAIYRKLRGLKEKPKEDGGASGV